MTRSRVDRAWGIGLIAALVSVAACLSPTSAQGVAQAGEALVGSAPAGLVVETISKGYATGGPVGQMFPGNARMSDDGDRVLFQADTGTISKARACSSQNTCVFVRDRSAGVTTVASSLSDGTPVAVGFSFPVMSGDGRFVAFGSTSRRFDPDAERPAPSNLLVKNLDTGRMKVIAGPVTDDGQRLSFFTKGISTRGRYVTVEANLPRTPLYGLAFVYDRREQTWTRFGQAVEHTSLEAVSDNGQLALAYNGSGNGTTVARDYRIYQMHTGRSWPVPRPAGTVDAIIYSAYFSADSQSLAVNWEDSATATTAQIHRASDGSVEEVLTNPSVGAVRGMDATGRRLAVVAIAGTESSRFIQAAVYDRVTGELTTVGYGPTGRRANSGAYPLDISTDAHTVLFNTDADNIAPEGGDTPPDRTDPYYENDYFVATLP